MKTRERAKALSSVTEFSFEDLIGLVNKEFGNPNSLDEFVEYGDIFVKAKPVSPILHILAGNTPEAAIQSLTRGLLIGAYNQVKLPKQGIKDFDNFIKNLPSELISLVETTSNRKVADDWINSASAVIAFGSDETLMQIAETIHPSQIFIPHNHKISLAVIDSDENLDAAQLAAIDIYSHDQRGCLSPHDIYVCPKIKPRSFASRLANELNLLNKKKPPEKRTTEESAAIDHLRRSYEFRACNDTSVQIWKSENNLDWTVVYEDEIQFAQSPLGQFVFVKPLPKDLTKAVSIIGESISTIALHPFKLERAESLILAGGNRVCPLGSSQKPSTYWHHDGYQSLAPLVRWVNAG